MADKEGNRDWLLGCATLLVPLFLCLATITVVALSRDRHAARYPGAQSMSSHSNYSGLPRQFRWDNAYRTTDNFTSVYNWYSVTFDLGAESRAIDRCILLEGSADYLLLVRYTSVFLCNTATGQTINVTRSTSLK
jgi:hypothetical protein